MGTGHVEQVRRLLGRQLCMDGHHLYCIAIGQLGQDVDSYWLFVQTLPYRFYSILLLIFVWTVARTGRDFGPMARAEQRAVATGEVSRSGSSAPPAMDEIPEGVARRGLVRNALVPLLGLVGGRGRRGAVPVASGEGD